MKIYREIPTDANSLVTHEQIMDEITLAIGNLCRVQGRLEAFGFMDTQLWNQFNSTLSALKGKLHEVEIDSRHNAEAPFRINETHKGL